MNGGEITHVIVGSHTYNHDIPHREHKLAKYLLEKPSTRDLYWIYPDAVPSCEIEKKEDDLTQIKFPTMYKNYRVPVSLMDKYPFENIFTKKFEELLNELSFDRAFLWYYSPRLSFISKYSTVWQRIIYDCSDDHTTTGWRHKNDMGRSRYYRSRLNSYLTQISENILLRNTDINFASSKILYRKIDNISSSETHLVETGVDIEKFNNDSMKCKRIQNLEYPRLGFVGKLKEKVDLNLIFDVAKCNPSWNIILVGPKRTNINKLLGVKNISWFGTVKPETVPQVMNSLDVGLMPYKEIRYNESVFPLKFNEYLASGLPVVGCGLPSTEDYVERGVYLHTSNKAEDFTTACSKALSWETGEEKRKKIASSQDWDSKFRYIYNKVFYL